MTFHWTIHPSMLDWLRPDKATYNPGDVITFTTRYSAPVFVTGSPYLQLWDTKRAVYTSGSGTQTLTFTYQVVQDDPQVSGYSVTEIRAGNGSITTADGVAANLINYGYPYQTAPTLSIVGTTPQPDAVIATNAAWAPQNVGANDLIIGLTFSHDVTVTGTPLLHVSANGVARTAPLWSHSQGLVQFLYTPQPGDVGPLTIQSPIDLNSGTITGANGLAVNLTFAPPNYPGPAAPVITAYDSASSTPSFHGTSDAGATVTLTQGYSLTGRQTTAAADGTWMVAWNGTPLAPGKYSFSATATDASGRKSSSSPAVTVTVAPTSDPVVQQLADRDTGYQYIWHDETNYVHVNATNAPTQFNATGLPHGVSFATDTYQLSTTGSATGIFFYTYGGFTGGAYTVSVTATNSVGTSAPMTFHWTVHQGMNDFLSTDKRVYYPGDTITFTAKFSAPVVVTGTPYIQLWGTKRATYASGSGTTTLKFTYQVTSDDPQASYLSYDTITAGGGTIQTVDGVSASLRDTYFGLGTVPTFSISASTAVPVIADATVTGQVGTPITPVQLLATNSPTGFSSDNSLRDYGLAVSSGGVVSGTPTQAAAGVAVKIYALNILGSSAPGTLTLNIAAAPVTTPPPPPPPPPSPSKADQTITFSSPVSAIIVGQPITLGAISSAGLPITYAVVSGDATISGNVLTPTSTAPLVVRATSLGNDSVNAAVADVSFGNPQKAAQAISLSTTAGSVPAEKSITLNGTATSGLPVTYSVVSGPATISGNTLTFTGTGAVVVRAYQPGDGTYAAASDATMTFTAVPIDRLVNLSSRLHIGPDAAHLAIAGFVITGGAPKPILVRAVGPSLSTYGVSDGVAAPQLQLVDSSGKVIATNSGWNNDAQISAAVTAVGAFGLASESKDAAVLVNLSPGAYTAQVSAPTAGSVLIEVYDVSANEAVPTKQLINISTRGFVDAGDSMIGGFVVGGSQPKKVLIRAVGPGLGAFGVSGTLADPAIKVYDSTETIVAQNDNWETPQSVPSQASPATAAQIAAADTAAGAFALQPGAKDSAVLLTLAPGAYTAVVTGANGTTGAALVEIYEVMSP